MPPKPAGKAAKGAPAPSHGTHFNIPRRVTPAVIAPVHPTLLHSNFCASPSFLLVSRSAVSVEAAAATKPATATGPSSTPTPTPAATTTALTVKHQPTFQFSLAEGVDNVCANLDGRINAHSIVTDPVTKENLEPLSDFSSAAAATNPNLTDPIKAVDCGTNHFALITQAGLMVAGLNDYGQLGTTRDPTANKSATELTMVKIPRMETKSKHVSSTTLLAPSPTLLDVACGSKHTLVVVVRSKEDAYFDDPKAADGFISYSEVLGCGYSKKYALGASALASCTGSSVIDSGLVSIVKLRTESVDRVWAQNDLSFARGSRGLLAFGTFSTIESGTVELKEPTLVLPASSGSSSTDGNASRDARVVSVAIENSRVFALTSNDRVMMMRILGEEGTVTFDDITDQLLEKVKTITATSPLPLSFRRLTSGREHTCALLADGSVVGWGQNSFGQLGAENGYVSNPLEAVIVSRAPADQKPEMVTMSTSPDVHDDTVSVSSKATTQHQHHQPAATPSLIAQWPQGTVSNVCCGPWSTLLMNAEGAIVSHGRGAYRSSGHEELH